MKKPRMTDQEFDQLLEEAKDDLQAMRRNSPPITPERIKELKTQLEKIHPFLRVLTAQQMEALLLKLLEQKSMTGYEIAAGLEKANIRLKEGGEGVLYGLLAQLEAAGCVRGDRVERGDRVIRIYRLTDKGAGSLQTVRVAASELKAWSDLVLSFN